jgi:glycosyltransferase involved in cell wall biosynthesis
VRHILARIVLARANTIRVVSSPLRQALTQKWGLPETKIAVIPVPVSFDKQPETIQDIEPKALSNPSSKVVLFVGRLCHQKNLPGLFAVATQVLQTRSDVEFVLVGDGPERRHAVERAAALDADRVHVEGSIPYATLANYYRRADVVILPSLYEGFGRVILEGYLFGTPAVATRCGGPEDIIIDGETGFLTEIEDMEGFASHTLWFLSHPDEARRLGERGRAHVQRMFEPQKLVGQMMGQWEQMTRTGASNR